MASLKQIWSDLQQGKRPWRPRLSVKSVVARLAFSLPFLCFGGYLVYRTADCHVRLERDTAGVVQAVVVRRFWNLPICWKSMGDVTDVRVDTESRRVDKRSTTGASSGRLMEDVLSVSKIVLQQADGTGELAVSEFRFYSDATNHETATRLDRFLSDGRARRIEATVPFESTPVWPSLAVVFLLGLGGFLFVSLLIDFLIWGVQKRYQRRARRRAGATRRSVKA